MFGWFKEQKYKPVVAEMEKAPLTPEDIEFIELSRIRIYSGDLDVGGDVYPLTTAFLALRDRVDALEAWKEAGVFEGEATVARFNAVDHLGIRANTIAHGEVVVSAPIVAPKRGGKGGKQ